MRKRSPQEDKALSYTRDRRNDYGGNDKGSRTSIRRRKRWPNRSDRHRARQSLLFAGGPLNVERAETAEERVRVRRSAWDVSRWRKRGDASLAETVRYTLRRRERLGIDDADSVELRLGRVEQSVNLRRSLPAYAVE